MHDAGHRFAPTFLTRELQLRLQSGTILGFHKTTQEQYLDLKVDTPLPSYPVFKDAFLSLVPHFKARPELPAQCPICKDHPQVLFCDGEHAWCAGFIALNAGSMFTMHTGLYCGCPITTATGDEEARVQAVPHLTRLQRCFITGSQQQEIRAFLRVLAGVRRRAADPDSLTEAELKRLLSACPASARSARLFSVLNACAQGLHSARRFKTTHYARRA